MRRMMEMDEDWYEEFSEPLQFWTFGIVKVEKRVMGGIFFFLTLKKFIQIVEIYKRCSVSQKGFR